MALEVIKKDGSREPFDASKIRTAVRAAASSTELSEERVNEIVAEVSSKAISVVENNEEAVLTDKLRDIILSELDRVAPAVSAVWRKHGKQKE